MSPPCVREAELEAALDGRLPTAERDALLAHARACARCGEALSARETLREALSSLPRPRPDALAMKRARAAVMTRALRDANSPSTSRRAVALAVAAALLLALAVTLRPRRSPTPAPALPAGAVALSTSGWMLPARGAAVRVLRAGAVTEVAVDEGAAEFIVRRRARGERFVVRTDDAAVEVRGTRFTVTADHGALREVSVREGRVAVRHAGSPERALTAGQRFEVAPPVEVASAPEPTLATTPPLDEPEPAPTPSPSPRPAPRAERSRTLPRPDPGEALSRDFREGALAYLRRDDAAAIDALGSFLSASSADDERREDARYVRTLALARAGREVEARRDAALYLREFPDGVRRAEVASQLVRMAARAGDCEQAARAALSVPEGANARLRAGVARALEGCRR
ncbi:MAG: FecR family protein [Polyangiales bacterium]